MSSHFPKPLKSITAAILILQLVSPAFVFGQMTGQPQVQSTQQDQTAPKSMPRPLLQPDQQGGMQAAGKPGSANVPLTEAPDETIAPLEMTLTQGPGSLSPDEKILMVLNRFTYGPRPGDLERAREEGLSKWFSRQLNPWKIDDSALDRRLQDYPAMQLPIGKLMEMYPDGNLIRDVMSGRNGIPGGEGERALYYSQMDRYKEKKAAKNEPERKADNPPALPEEPAAYLAMEPRKRFEELTKLSPAMMNDLRRRLPEADRARLTDGFTTHEIEILAAFTGPENMITTEIVQTKLLRDIFSERQLNEIMVDFWLNHFNVYMRKSQQEPYFIAGFERDTIRPRAMGSFENLLVATALSPAMLNYLDNAESIGPKSDSVRFSGSVYNHRFIPDGGKKVSGLNENYARELMELHTVGVNGGYSQHDVTDVAKVFTGWTLSKGSDGLNVHPTWDVNKHEPGDKMVMGAKVKYDGMKEGLQVLHMLASSPQCAHFISYKLAVRFVSDTPPPAMVDAMAKTFLETHGQIRQVLATMINSPEFFTRENYQAKVKTPQEYVVSAVRAAGASVDTAGSLAATISDLGMPIYGMMTPQGYSMKADAWNSTAALIARLNFALALSSNRVAGVHVDWGSTLKATGNGSGDARALAGLAPEQKDLRLEEYLLHVHVGDRTRQTILSQIEVPPAQQQATLRQIVAKNNGRDPLSTLRQPLVPKDTGPQDAQTVLAAGLILGSPEFQRR